MNKIRLTKYYIEIQADAKDEQFLRLLSSIDTIEKKKNTRDTYRCSLYALPEVLEVMRGITSADQLNGVARELYEEEILRRQKTSDLKRCGPDESYPGLWEHQNLGVCLARYNRRFNFYYDTRTGKTRMSYQIMLNALKEGRAKRCLVVAPSAIIPDWLADARQFPSLRVVAYYKNAKQKREALSTPCHIVIWSLGTFIEDVELLKKIKFDICVFDESSKLKAYNSKTSKAAMELALTIPSWYNLSATPAPNGEHEYYAQMQCVAPHEFSSYITHFKAKFFDNASWNSKFDKLVIKPNMKEEFKTYIEAHSIYVDQSVMPLAAKCWHQIPFALSDSTWTFYKQMASDMALQVDDTTIIADQAVAMRAKLNQITSGFILDTEAIKDNKILRKLGETADGKEVYRLDECERNDALRLLIDKISSTEPDASIIIWANYAEEFVLIRELLGDAAVYVRGGTTTADREAAIASFRSKEVRFMVAHPLSIGMGINLTVSHHAIYYSINDSWEALKQSSERICGHIDIQPYDCNYWILLAANTVNELIYKNVSGKKDASLGFLEHLKAVAFSDYSIKKDC